MNKYKWLIVDLPMNLSDLSKLMSKHKFSHGSKQGFILSKASESELTGKFLEEKILIKEVFNPFGESNEISTTDYIVTNFSFNFISSKNIFLLELKNQPRTLRPFINFLNKIIGLGLTLNEFKFNPIQIADEIENIFGKITISKINISELNIKNKATANIQINSETDVREVLNSTIFKDKKFNIKSIQASFTGSEYSGGKIQLFSNSTIILNNIPERTFIKIFTKFLLDRKEI